MTATIRKQCLHPQRRPASTIKVSLLLLTIVVVVVCPEGAHAWIGSNSRAMAFSRPPASSLIRPTMTPIRLDQDVPVETSLPKLSRRNALHATWTAAAAAVVTGGRPLPSHASDDNGTTTKTTATALVTDKIYLDIQGLPVENGSDTPSTTRRIVIGLFGRDVPRSTAQIRRLVDSQNGGLVTPCRPRAERTLQKEQLEANKVYAACRERASEGVTWKYSTVWRIRRNARIDLGAVTGRFLAREFPMWEDETSAASGVVLKHDAPGTVSVRRGNEGGFGCTIVPSAGATDGGAADRALLDQEHIVVGRVIEGMDVVEALNNVPVVASSSLNYMSLTGGPKANNAPDRSCRYGGNMYCNENKPLIKVSIADSGVL